MAKQKKLLLLGFSAVLILFVVFVIYKIKDKDVNSFNQYINKIDKSREGYVSNGFLDVNSNQVIDRGVFLPVQDGKASGTISMGQNLEGNQNYLLFLLVDFEQHEFMVENKVYDKFYFSLEGNEEIQLPVTVRLTKENPEELEYLIIREPDITKLSIENDTEWTKFIITKNFYTWQLALTEEARKPLPLDSDSIAVLDLSLQLHAELVRDYTQLTVLPQAYSLETVHLVLGGLNDETITYAVIAFSNWEQITFENGDKVKYIEVPAGKSISLQHALPAVDAPTPYQFFIFPNVEKRASIDDFPPFSTFRTIVHPDKEKIK